MEAGVSAVVTVQPPFDLSPFSAGVQFVLGLLWVEFEGDMSSMGTLVNRQPSPSCSTCLCTLLFIVPFVYELH